MKSGWAAAFAAGVVLTLGACTADDSPGVATAGETSAASPSASASADSLSQELQFVACMRREGIEDMPDPVPGDSSGRSAVRYAIDVMGKGSDDAFQTALDTCMNLLPAPEPQQPPSADDAEGYRRFAQCMRDNGILEFPDYDPNNPGYIFVSAGGDEPVKGVQKVNGIVVLNLGDPLVSAAFKTCQGMLPNNDD